jgi:hypothetical protein
MEALHAHYASISGALRVQSHPAGTELSPCLAPNTCSPDAERSHGVNNRCGGERGYGAAQGADRGYNSDRRCSDAGSGGACGREAYGDQAPTVANRAALERARRAASCGFSAPGATSPGLNGAPQPQPLRASLSSISLFDEDAPAVGTADASRMSWARSSAEEDSDLI